MAKSLATLFVDLRASSRHLKGDINRAMSTTQSALKRAQASMRAAFRGVSIAAAAATAALVAMNVQGAAAVDALAKTSSRLGIVTEELQGLRVAGRRTGVEIRTLEMGIQRMTRRVSEAAQGTGEAQKALQELGLDAAALNRMSPDEQFRAIADAMEGVTNQADRVRLAMRLFDSEGVALVNTLALTRRGLDEARDFVRRYGLEISRIDAARVEAANDAWADARDVIAGSANVLAVEMAPALQTAANALLDMAAKNGGFRKEFKLTADLAVAFGATLVDAVRNTRLFVKAGEQSMLAVAALAMSVGVTVTEGIEGIVNTAIEGLNELIKAANRLPGVDVPLLERVVLGERGEQVLARTKEAAQLAQREFLELLRAAKPSEAIIEAYGELLGQAGELGGTAATSAKKAEQAFSSMRDRVGDELTGLVTRGKFNFKSLADYAIEQFARIKLVDPILNAVLGGKSGGGGSGGFFGNVLGSIFGGFKAEGGPVSGGRAYVVGERGPELFVPQASGSIVPNHAMGGAPVTVNQTFHFSPGVQPADLVAAAGAIKEETLAAVYEARRRGGAFA